MSKTGLNQLCLFEATAPKRRHKASPEASKHSPPPYADAPDGTLLIYSAKDENDWRAKARRRDDDDRTRRLLERVPPGPCRRTLSPPPSASLFEEMARKFPNFEPATACIRDYATLCSAATGLRLRPILLSGAPGLGKTAYARHLARLLAAPMLFVNVASATAGFSIGGLDTRWASGGPGCVFDAMVLADPALPANRLMLIDEVDKAPPNPQYEPLGAFYSLLEPSTARRFRDEACDLPIDASAMIFIATCNDVGAVPVPLLSRMEVFQIRQPEPSEMAGIVESAWADLHQEEGWWARRFVDKLDPPVIAALSTLPSARDVVKRLRRAAGHAARDHRIRIEAEDISASGGDSDSPPRRIGFA